MRPRDLGRFEPTPYDLGVTDYPDATWAEVREPCGPRFSDPHDPYLAQDAPLEAERAGCTDAVYDLALEEITRTLAAA